MCKQPVVHICPSIDGRPDSMPAQGWFGVVKVQQRVVVLKGRRAVAGSWKGRGGFAGRFQNLGDQEAASENWRRCVIARVERPDRLAGQFIGYIAGAGNAARYWDASGE